MQHFNHVIKPSNDIKSFYEIDYLAAMGEPGGGRNEVDPRFISMFSVYNVTFPSSETLNYIYTSILSGHLQTFPEEVQSIANGLVQLMLELYEVILQQLFIMIKYQQHMMLFRQLEKNYYQRRPNSITFSTCVTFRGSWLVCFRVILTSIQA